MKKNWGKYLDEKYAYDGTLGAQYSPEETVFRLWSPAASKAYVNLYKSGNPSTKKYKILPMQLIKDKVWVAVYKGDLKNMYYTYSVTINGKKQEAVDPYAKAAGVNGKRGMVVDLLSTNPPGWENDKSPPFKNPTDAIIYELHIRDFSISENSGMINKANTWHLQKKEQQIRKD